jgi:alpha-beta hydrolase superfamily lysophospholipase
MSSGTEHKENGFEASDKTRLFSQYWRSNNPKAVLIIVHGLKDHSSRYDRLAEELAGHDFAVHAFDLRGHGKSEGERAFVKSFDEYLQDLELFHQQVQRTEPGTPIFLFGHSMGGAIALLYTLTGNPHIRGLVLSAPALKVGDDVSSLLVWLTKLIAGIAPKRPVLKLDNNLFTRDTDFLAAMNSDPLIYNKPHPARTAAELVRAIERIQKTMSSLAVPVLVMHGTADKITNPDGSRQLNEQASSKDKTLKLYEGHYHDLLHDLGNSNVLADLLQWLEAHTNISLGTL